MKSKAVQSLITIILLAVFGVPIHLGAQSNYTVVTLPTLGGTAGGASSINNGGWVTGSDNLAGDNIAHATLWLRGAAHDLGTLGGPNSSVSWPVKNDRGIIVGIAETTDADPLNESWSCSAFFPSATGHICLGFKWQNGVMKALPTLGGNNGYATAGNNRGQIVGWAENTVHDPTCVAPQVLQFRAAIWGPKDGEIQELPPLPGDTSSAATAINDKGQAVGISGICDVAVGRFTAKHAVLWENGVPTDIGSLGGTSWNTPTAINNQGTVVGFSNRQGDTGGIRNYHAFIWTKDGGMHDLDTLPGDTRSAAFGVNDRNQIVGLSRAPNGLIRAVLWENGAMTDLNSLVPAGSPFLLYANDINDRGEIVGEAFDATTGNAPAFVAVPDQASAARSSATGALRPFSKAEFPDKVRRGLSHKLGLDWDSE